MIIIQDLEPTLNIQLTLSTPNYFMEITCKYQLLLNCSTDLYSHCNKTVIFTLIII